mgnify:CR=1 FL=1
MKEKMKATRYVLAGIVLPMMFAGCLDEYQKLNTDPEQLGTTDPRYVFTGATMNFTNQSRSHLTGKYGGVMIYMQYLVSEADPPPAITSLLPSRTNIHSLIVRPTATTTAPTVCALTTS